MLGDGRGAPLSLIAVAANRQGVSQLELVLGNIMVWLPNPPLRRSKRLCADAAYRGWKAKETIRQEGYIAYIVGRAHQAKPLRSTTTKKARCRTVKVALSWFNRFHKLLVRYEKLHRSLVALNYLAAAIIVFMEIKFDVNIIRG